MSRTRKNHRRPTKFTLLANEIERLEAELRGCEWICKTTENLVEKRRVYDRVQRLKTILVDLRARHRKLKHRLKPAETLPLFDIGRMEE